MNKTKQELFDAKKTTIQVTQGMKRKLHQYKYKLNCKTIEELFEKVLKIVKAGNFK